jgi:hypothetical protein
MSEQPVTDPDPNAETVDLELQSRRDFLLGLGRWSKIAIGAAVLGGLSAGAPEAQAGAWVNRRGVGGAVVVTPAVGGGAWINNRVGVGGGAWVNNRGGGGAWVNRR